MKLWFRISDIELIGYSDVDFKNDVDDRKSIIGYIFLFGRRTTFWLSKKYRCIAKSTMEAKYLAFGTSMSTTIWMKRFIENLDFGASIKSNSVFCDN